jgi:hypothetical protein
VGQTIPGIWSDFHIYGWVKRFPESYPFAILRGQIIVGILTGSELGGWVKSIPESVPSYHSAGGSNDSRNHWVKPFPESLALPIPEFVGQRGPEYSDLESLGFENIAKLLHRVQEKRNEFMHGKPEAIDDTLIEDIVGSLKEEHESWIKVFNLRAVKAQ